MRVCSLRFGFRVDSAYFCPAHGTCAITVTYTPVAETSVVCRLLVTQSTGTAVLTLTGGGARSRLRILDAGGQPLLSAKAAREADRTRQATTAPSTKATTNAGSTMIARRAGRRWSLTAGIGITPAAVSSSTSNTTTSLVLQLGNCAVSHRVRKVIWITNDGSLAARVSASLTPRADLTAGVFQVSPRRGDIAPGKSCQFTVKCAGARVKVLCPWLTD